MRRLEDAISRCWRFALSFMTFDDDKPRQALHSESANVGQLVILLTCKTLQSWIGLTMLILPEAVLATLSNAELSLTSRIVGVACHSGCISELHVKKQTSSRPSSTNIETPSASFCELPLLCRWGIMPPLSSSAEGWNKLIGQHSN